MATNVLLPQWGMNMEDGTLTKWLVNEGDEIAEGQPLVEIETAKINSELESPASGVVAHIMAAEGSLVKVGEMVAVIAEPGENPPRPEPVASSAAARRRPRQGAERPARGSGSRQVTPVARRLARDNNIDIDEISGTGPRGRVTEQDVRDAIEARQRPQRSRVQVVPRARQLAGQGGHRPRRGHRFRTKRPDRRGRRRARHSRARCRQGPRRSHSRGRPVNRPAQDHRRPNDHERQHHGAGHANYRG